MPSDQSLFGERLRRLLSGGRKPEADTDYAPRHRTLVIATCVLTSFLLWFIFAMQETYTRVLEFKTTIENLPEEEALTVLPPSRVRVQVEGRGFQLLQLHYRPPTMVLDASQPVINLVDLAPEYAKNVRVESVSPREFDLSKEERITRRVPIAVRADVAFPSGGTYDMVVEPHVEPDSVSVSGARAIVENLAAWPTVSRNFAGVTDTLQAPIALLDTLTGLVSVDLDRAVLWAVVKRFTGGQRELPVQVRGLPTSERRVSLEPSAVTVKYRVLVSQHAQAANSPDFFATVSYEDIRSDTTGRVQPRIHYPADLIFKDVRVEPFAVRYYNVLIED